MVSQLATCKKPAHSHTNSPILHSATRNSDLVIIGADARNKHSESSSHQSPPLSRKYARHSEWGGAGGGSGSSGGSGGARGGVRAPAPQAVQWAETVADDALAVLRARSSPRFASVTEDLGARSWRRLASGTDKHA